MTEPKHTPGPWSEPCHYGATRFEVQGAGRRVAVFDRIEDANLGRSAPDLLEALEALLDQYLSAPPEATFGDGILDQDKALAAIAKARGLQ